MIKIIQKEVRKNDVFKVWYKTNKEERYPGSLRHCFEGTLVAVQDEKEGLIFVDTYWGIGDRQGKEFTFSEMMQKFEVKHYCNLDDLEKSNEHAVKYYDDKDIYTISEQHACSPSCIHYFLRKGAVRSKEKMLNVINEKIQKEKRSIEYSVREIELLSEKKEKINSGDLNVYL